MIPNDFIISYAYIFENFSSNYTYDILIGDILDGEVGIAGSRVVIVVGEMWGSSKVFTLRYSLYHGVVMQGLQTLDIIATAGTVDTNSGRVIIGHLDGTLLMYDFGLPYYPSREDVDVRRVSRIGEGMVFDGHLSTGIMLEQKNDGNTIFPISYNNNRTLLFGTEGLRRWDLDRTYNIWYLETGEMIQPFDLDFAFRTDRDGRINSFGMQMNSYFTYAIVSTVESPRRYFYSCVMKTIYLIREE